jgi:hypothetical protein
MVKSDDPRGIDQHVTTLLLRISPRPLGQLSSKQLQQVRPPHGWTHEIPELGFPHAVRVIELTLLVHEKRPPKARLFGIGLDKVTGLEGHDDDLNAKLAEALYRVLHLHEVPSARQSPEVAVEHHQEPATAVILEATDFALGIGQRKRHSGLANQIGHEVWSRFFACSLLGRIVTAWAGASPKRLRLGRRCRADLAKPAFIAGLQKKFKRGHEIRPDVSSHGLRDNGRINLASGGVTHVEKDARSSVADKPFAHPGPADLP